jgi:hypothetical protein
VRTIVAALLLTLALNASAIQRQSQAPIGGDLSRSDNRSSVAIGPKSADRAPVRSGGCMICEGSP